MSSPMCSNFFHSFLTVYVVCGSWSIKTLEGFFEQAKRKSNWIQNQIILNLISLYFLAASKGSSSSSFFLWWNSELSTQATEANATEVSQPEELEDQPAWLHMYTYHAWWSIKNKPFLLHSVPSWPDNALAVCYVQYFYSKRFYYRRPRDSYYTMKTKLEPVWRSTSVGIHGQKNLFTVFNLAYWVS